MIDPASPNFAATPARRERTFSYGGVSYERPVVSIVTPWFNTGAIFRETAGSVFAQSFQNWEWLIVNDGSTDPEALAVLGEYRNSDSRIRIIDLTNNRGLSEARNEGYAQARSEFVVQLDSDDLLEPTAIEKWLWYLLGHSEAAFVKGYSVGFGALSYLWTRGFDMGSAFLQANQVDPTAMVRREVHRLAGGFDAERRAGLEDWDFWLRCANAGYWGGTVPEFLSWYRRRDNHGDRWGAWNPDGVAAFVRQARSRYPKIFRRGGFPVLPEQESLVESGRIEVSNPLTKQGRRLLLMVPWLRPGGADKCNVDLISQLRQRGWEVTVVASLASPQEWGPRFTALTSDVFVLPNFLNPAQGPDFVSYLIASRNPDVVLLSHSEFGYMLLPFLRREFPALPVLDLNHIEEMGWRNGGYPRMSVGTGHLLDRQLVISDHLRRWMVGEGADPSRIEVCYLNVDERLWRPDAAVRAAVRAKYDVGDDTPVIVFAGRICPQKQPQVLASVLNALASRGLEFVALVAGDGEDMPSLRRAVKRGAAARRVRLLGMTGNDEVRRLMQAADVFFLPSEWEGIALGIYEAMSCGLAIVGADVGGQRELVTKECGILLPRGEVIEETARYTEALASLVTDPARIRSMGLASRERIERRFRLDQMGDCFAKVLTSAVDRGPASARPEDREASEARERSVQFLAAQWRYARRRSLGGASMRILKAVPLPAGYRGAIAGAYRVWRSEGAKGVAQRIRDRLGAKWRRVPGRRSQ